jgi:nucleoid-associated protein YgaU
MTATNQRRIEVPIEVNRAGIPLMAARSIGRIVVPALAVVAVGGAALAFGITQFWREPPPETTAANAAPPPSRGSDTGSAALAKARAEATAVAAQIAVSPAEPVSDPSVPVFDVARIERTGEAVIAGRAAPGAVVELLRNGERQDQAVADPTGQFVMVPPRLPPGNYELTLRSRLPDGTLVTSKHGVGVALAELQPSPVVLQSQADGVARPVQTASAAPDGGSLTGTITPRMETKPATKTESRISTKVISRGDSLWRISRITYGDGTRYAVVYQANREKIRDPNRIYPGQVIVIPTKPR